MMLSMKPIKSAGDAAHYFMGADNYYLSDVQGKEFSEWAGEGAKQLGLSGQIDAKQFTAMLKGYLPNNEIVGLQKDGSIKHRPGFDLTFSAPKSVSVMALVLGKKEFIEMHNQAVNDALSEIERMCAQARKVNDKGEIEYENTENLIIAKFMHDTSRAMDPALHTHNVVLNATQRLDKLWRALASSDPTTKSHEKNGFYERVLGNQFYFSNIYRSSLAKNVVGHGYEIKRTGPHGMWEIKDFPKEILDLYSKRRKEIKAILDQKELFSAKAADVATQDSRSTKQNIDRDELRQIWLDEMKGQGYTPQKLVEALEKIKAEQSRDEKASSKNQLLTSEEAIREAVEHLSQFKTTLDYSAILTKAIEFSLGQIGYKELCTELNHQISNNELIELDDKMHASNKGASQKLTTKTLVEKEMALLNQVEGTKNSINSIKMQHMDLAHFSEAQDIKDDVTQMLKSTDRIILVETNGLQGKKKALLNLLLNVGEHAGNEVKILTPSRSQANETSIQVARQPQTLWRWLMSINKSESAESLGGFLYRYEHEVNRPFANWRQQKDILIVEQAEKLSYQDTQKLIEMTEKQKARVIFLNNGVNNRYFVGSPADVLKKSNIQQFDLKPGYAQFKVAPALYEIKDDDERLKNMVNAYKELTEQERKSAALIVGSKKEREVIVPYIRDVLKNQGELGRVEKSILTYQPYFMSDAEKKLASQYKPDLIVRLYEKPSSRLMGGLGRNEQIITDYTISSIAKKDNILILSDQNGKILRFDPRKTTRLLKNNYENENSGKGEKRTITGISIFEKKTLAIAEGELLIATATNLSEKNSWASIKPKLPIKNGELLRVTQINQDGFTLERNLGKNTERLKIENANISALPLDYQYVHTLNKMPEYASGKIIAALKEYTLSKDHIEQLAKRTPDQVIIFTNNSFSAQKKLEKHSRTAIDTVIQSYNQLDGIQRQLQAKDVLSIQQDLQVAIQTLNTQSMPTLVQEAASFAIEKLSEREAAFKHADLINTALEFLMDKLSTLPQQRKNKESLFKEISESIYEKQKTGELIMGRYFSDDTRWTTKESLAYESNIIKTIEDGKKSISPILSGELAKNYLLSEERERLTEGQRNACHLILTTTDRFVAVQGYAGTGKSTMFSSIKSLYEPLTNILKASETQTRQVVGLAPTHKAVKELRDKGIEAQTLQSFIIEQKKLQKENLLDLKDKLIIVDEVSMVGNKDYSDLVSLMKEGNAQVVLAGDISQLNAIPSGKPQQLLLDRDLIAVAHMKDIVRQKEPVLKEAVEKTIQKNYTEAFNLLEKQSTNTVNRDRGQLELLNPDMLDIKLDQLKSKLESSIIVCPESKAAELIADDLFSRTKEVQENTLIGTDSHHDRTMLHGPIREKYKMTGELSKAEVLIQRLVASRIEKAEYQRIQNYATGQVLKIGKDFYQVDKIESDQSGKGALHLIKEADKTTCLFIPDKEYKKVSELYNATFENVSVGEKIRLTRTDKLREHIANEEYKVIGINKSVLQLEKSADKRQLLTLDTTTFKDTHWDYAYTSTAFGAQGGTGQFSIIYANPELEHLVNYRSFGVMVTRAEKHVAIYTPDKEKLVSKIINSFAEKYSAIEVTDAKKENIKLSDIKKHQAEPTQTSLNKEQVKPRYDAKEINRQLTNNVEIIATHLLGEKNHHLSKGSNWRYGTKGSLSVQVSGQYQGTWHSFQTGEKGNLLALIQKELGLTFVEALEYAAKLTGEDYKQLIAIDKKTTPINDKSKIQHPEDDGSKIREYGRKLVKESTPIKNTLAERYLKETRKIQDIGEADLRFHQAVSAGKNEQGKPIYYPALLAIARDNQGNIMSVQATYLDPKTHKKAALPVTKRTYGALKDHQANCAIYEAKENKNSPNNEKINRQKNNKVTYLAEGVETALSVKDIVKNQDVFAVLGKSNFKNIDPNKLNSTVVLCIDNDGKDTYNKALFDAVKVIEATGREVKIHVPPAIKERGTDINDLVQLQGLEKAGDSLNRLVAAKDLHIHAAEFAGQTDKNLTEKQKKIDLNINKVSSEIAGNLSKNGIKNEADKVTINVEKMAAIHKNRNANLDKINQEMNKNIRAVAIELAGKSTLKDTKTDRKTDQDLAKNEREIY